MSAARRSAVARALADVEAKRRENGMGGSVEAAKYAAVELLASAYERIDHLEAEMSGRTNELVAVDCPDCADAPDMHVCPKCGTDGAVWVRRDSLERDPTETEVKLARALLAWKRLADRGFGPPEKWEAYEWHGFKLDMAGSEEWFSDLFEAEAVKAACVAADGLAESVLAKRDPEASP